MIDLADDHYGLDVSRASKLLGWEPKHSLRETLPKMVEALKRDPAAWYRESRTPLTCVGQRRDVDGSTRTSRPAGTTTRRPGRSVCQSSVLRWSDFVIASYLALYQWRIVSWVWDPFFPEGSLKILNSKISNILPIPDAALGAISYLVDAVTGAIGGRARWRTMPWIVIVFGLAVGPLGVVSVMLVVFQPVLFDAWCTLCLASAVVSLMMIGPAMDEFLASLQHLKRASDEGMSLWRVFWGLRDTA